MPGAAFIEKLLINFPDLNARWLLTGVGEMTMNAEGTFVEESIPADTAPDPQNVVHNKNRNRHTAADKPVDKVLLLFSDGTFIDYEKK
jgi:hypothetical protein